MKATLRLVGAELPRAVFKREPYVTAITVCEKTTGGAFPLSILPRTPAAGEEPEPGAEKTLTVVTEPTAGVDRGHPLELDVVLFDGDPGSWLVCRGTVMESDGGFRKAGARLDHARHAIDGTPLGLALVAGLGAPGVAASLAADAAGAVAGLLVANGDDVLCDFEVRLDSVAAYRKQPAEFQVHTPACTVKLTWTVEGLTADEEPLKVLEVARVNLDKIVERAGVAVDSGEVVPEGQEVKPRELTPGETLQPAEPARRPIAVPPARKAPEKGTEG